MVKQNLLRGKQPLNEYRPNIIENKWQKKWEEEGIYASHLEKENKFYCLAEFAYPSGDLHMGHWFTWSGADIFARMKRMQGLNVFFPNGFDAFGLPAENAAIKRKIHPLDWTMSNIEAMKHQFASMGASFSFDHQVITCLPEYYKWNQWIFLKMFEKGIAYRGKAFSNWCPSCQTVLADEQVVAGECDRCGLAIEQKQIDQWFLKITEYADRLLWDKDSKLAWPRAVKEGQNNWIGKSEGIEIEFRVHNSNLRIKVFTVFPETIFGVTYMVVAPEYDLVQKLITPEQKQAVDEYIKASQKKSEVERKSLDKDKTGVFTGSYCINPANGEKVPIWVADYVIASYGTGAVMGVPGSDHRDFAFAKKYDLFVIRVIGKDKNDTSGVKDESNVLEEGFLVNSEQFSGLTTPEPAREKIKDWMEEKGFGQRKVNYHLRDWSVSRQRYWGTPVPIIHCLKCGLVPVPEKDLPVELPYEVDFTPQGKPPLATIEAWIKVICPKCGQAAQRDTETLDGFFDNSWYFLRYLDPKNSKEIFDAAMAKKWLPVDIYFGGAEHNLGHTMYSRFFIKFLFDLGLVSVEEYADRRVNHGIVLGPDGNKMSKSKGNVVNPDEEVKKYGADAVRIHLAFFMPYEGTGPWVSERVEGTYRFLQRVWLLGKKVTDSKTGLFQMHKTIKKVTEDIEGIKFNTAVAALMEWLNFLSKNEIGREEYETFLLLLAPFAPHITEELWQQLGNKFSIHQHDWPKYDPKLIEEEKVIIPVQVNGKLRATIQVQSAKCKVQSYVEELARGNDKVAKYLDNQEVKKVVFVQGKLINFVIG